MGEKKNIDINQLIFDPENPRLPRQLQGVRDEKRIIDYMVASGNIVELMYSIAELGYSDAEPLLVVPVDKDTFKVVEGNRRLAALKLLSNPGLTKVRIAKVSEIVDAAAFIPEKVPCIVYENRESILDYLGYRHITGVKDWGALEKAIYLNQLYQNHIADGSKDIYKQLAQMIGSKADYVKKLHISYQLYLEATNNDYYGLNIKEEDFSFSWITLALGRKEIQDFIGLDESQSIENLNKENYKKLFIWLFDPENKIVDESRSISKLADVIGSKTALEKLEKGNSLEEAVLYTDRPEKLFLRFLDGAKDQLKQAKLSIEQLSEMPLDVEETLEDINRLVKSIKGALNENFKEENPVKMDKDQEKMFQQFLEFMGKKSE